MSGTVTGWRPETNYVQSGLTDGRYVAANYTLLAAGPPRLANIGPASALAGSLVGSAKGVGEVVHPMGFIQQVGLNFSQQWSRIFEIGSDRSYFIPGRSVGQLQLGRVWFHGATLLRLLYAYYQDPIGPTTVSPMLPAAAAAAMANPHNVIVPPGFENVFVNLASDLFRQMIGVMMYIKDSNKETLGAGYFEACTIPNWGIQTDSQGLVYQESCGLQFERMVPIEVSAVPLISMATSNNSGGADTDYPGLEAALDGHGDLACTDRGHPQCPHRSGRRGGRPCLRGVAVGQAVQQRPLRLHRLRLQGARRPRQPPAHLHHLRVRDGCHRAGLRDRRGDAEGWGHVPGREPLRCHQPGHHDQLHLCGGRPGYDVRVSNPYSTSKEAEALDTMGRLAIAAVLIKMLDSHQDRMRAARASSMVRRVIQEGEEGEERQDHQAHLQSPYRGPRLFIPAAPASDPEEAQARYQMGFIPNVPVGMDQGMVRLASDETGQLKLASGMIGNAYRAVKKGLGLNVTQTPALGKTLTQAPSLSKTVAAAPFQPGAAPAKALTLPGAPAVAAKPVAPTPASDLRQTFSDTVAGAPLQPGAKPYSLVPGAPQKQYQAKGFVENLSGPAGVKAPAPPTTPPKPGAPVVLKDPSPAPKQKPLATAGGVLAGLGVAGLGYGLYKGTEKATELLSEEAAPTDWSMSRSGAPRLAKGVNEFGYVQY